MILEKIEKYSQLSFTKQNPLQTKAALQTCFYNLQNLKKIVEGNALKNQEIDLLKNKICRQNQINERNSQINPNRTLPEISITNMRSHSLINSFNNQTSRQNTIIKKSNYFDNLNISRSKQLFLSENILKNSKINELIKSSQRVAKVSQNNKQNSNTSIKNTNRNSQASIGKKKSLDFRKRKVRVQKLVPGLQKNQRYFQQNNVNVPLQVVQKLGLYQASNLYKQNNVQKFLKNGYEDNFKPVINLKFVTLSLCHRNQFFLTDNSYMPDINETDTYISQGPPKALPTKKQKQQIKRVDSNQNSKNSKKYTISSENKKDYEIIVDNQKLKQQTLTQESSKITEPQKIVQWILTIKGYQIVKNQHYYCFKKHNIQQWAQINFILNKIELYLEKVKISLLSFKFQKDLFLKQLCSYKRIQDRVLEKLLKIQLTIKSQPENQEKKTKTIRLFSSRAEIIKQLLFIWKDRKNLEIMKRNKQKQKDMLAWMSLRMIAKQKMKAARIKSINRAKLLNQKLRNGDWDYQIQIHIPSFSQSQFVRQTTQYMQNYQNMFYHMWKSSSHNKHFILIMPAINQVILQLFQQKIKLSKNITLICPESHELYPKSLPLAACLLYSKDALCRVKKILDGKKGIIIPGRLLNNNSSIYQHYLSDLLNCPLFCTLASQQLIGTNKNLWQKYQIPTAKFLPILPKSSIQNVIQKLSQLICDSPKTKIWILKMNGQFNGRGVAKFDADSSKKIKQILALQNYETGSKRQQHKSQQNKIKRKFRQQTKKLVIQYLQTHFRLKLKINFENCIFRVQQYIQKFLEKGGIIQEYLDECQTFQFCYKLEPGYLNYSRLCILDQLQQQKYISWAQNYEVDFVTKASVFFHQTVPKILKDFSKKVQRILKSEKYLGYISVTVLYSSKKQQYFGVQIKPYMTINSSISYFLKNFTEKKKQPTNRRNGNLISHTNIQSKNEISHVQNNKNNNGLIFLFIPIIIFTDVDEATRCEVIQNLVVQSWDNISIKLFNQPIVNQNSDLLYGKLYISLGLTLGLLIYGKNSELKKMKKEAVDCIRQLSDKIQTIKLYRGKKQIRDVYQFGDLIRAITKIKS